MATIYDVAKHAGVSTYTVSSVINRSAYVSPELTKRVLDAVKELNYTVNEVARSLQTRQTKTVGMLIPDISNPFYAQVVYAVEERLRAEGYALILGSTHDQPEQQSHYLKVFNAKQVDGLLLFAAPGDEGDLQPLLAMKKAIVFVGRRPRTVEADAVFADNVKGTRLAVEHLLGKGHKKVAIVVGPRGLSANEDRIEGWEAALKKKKFDAPANWIGEGDWTMESALAITSAWLANANDRPTAVFAANFLMMTGVLKAIKAANLRCPQDVEVMSSDDYDWLDAFEPAVSTVAQPGRQMGDEAAGLLLKRIKQPGRKPQSITLSPTLRVR
ncbi:MAG: LacI family DNA-binding transcriptional regulator [Deltaproteobacteria bacterium]|nr:LacI family DNA-binding transcriptional regulator [Deltaproteobacteria bacterium]